jgi:uncharacterized DUF497 family protein
MQASMDGEVPKFSWDSRKSDVCLADRGFDFALASRLFEGPTFERTDSRRDYGERVFKRSVTSRVVCLSWSTRNAGR